jgi:long-chain fatty acid transport protein
MTASTMKSFVVATAVLFALHGRAAAQPFGVELHNTMLPIAGGMGGASIAMPLEPLAAIGANPAGVTRFDGTQFQFGGGWADATFNMAHAGGVVPGVGAFAAKSGTPGTAVANIGMTRQLNLFDGDAYMGFGLISNAGAGVDFRDVPASNGTSGQILVLEMNSVAGFKVTDRLSVGSTLSVGTAYFDGLFVGMGAMVPDYALRASFGTSYDLTDATTLAFYYQTEQAFTFDDAIRLQLPGPGNFDVVRDVRMSLPANYGFGVANRALCDGRLTLAADFLLKQYADADLFSAVYRNQAVFQFGAQYALQRLRFRAGYVYAQNPLKTVTSTEAGGVVPPGGLPAVEYAQAQLALINRNRISFGVGVVDLMPGLDVDLFAGGMFRESAQLGAFTNVNVESYWIGLGTTYRFGRMLPGRRSGG